MLQGITNDLASYNPIYVTLDYADQYVRATRTSQITSADVNPVTGQITAAFTGSTDIPIKAYYYTGVDSGVTTSRRRCPCFPVQPMSRWRQACLFWWCRRTRRTVCMEPRIRS